MPNYAQLCPIMPNYAQLCPIMPNINTFVTEKQLSAKVKISCTHQMPLRNLTNSDLKKARHLFKKIKTFGFVQECFVPQTEKSFELEIFLACQRKMHSYVLSFGLFSKNAGHSAAGHNS